MIKASGVLWYSIFNAIGYLAAAIIFYSELRQNLELPKRLIF